ncbi:hypothetical protein Y1Q_0015814 [Alligator mississippiensis]|uniref:Uncharacterized protein n=1 Tax=Alligator mississippiensis TaxID=8496 RepID=A0A151MH33_ALLMI|nr:hypothetical protein Y1Q_0015814 [Alligator mississippiensis]
MEPEDIPDRDAGCWNANSSSCIFSHDCPPGTVQDFQKCKVATNQDRHVIERFKMDANREKEEATFGIPQAEEAWEDYMGFMRSAKLHMTEGLIVDIHGQAHPEQWIELGYTISKASLNSGLFSASGSSIQYLANQLGNVTFESLLRGHRSLGFNSEGPTSLGHGCGIQPLEA